MTVVALPSDALSQRQRADLRALFAAAWPDPDDSFTEDDWEHTFGGMHFFVEQNDRILSHASVVPRVLRNGENTLATGYVEGVATLPDARTQGLASAIIEAAGEHIRSMFALGALGTDLFSFYERFGWQRWPGELAVADGDRTPDEEGFVMVLRTSQTPSLDDEAPLICDPRSGDVW